MTMKWLTKSNYKLFLIHPAYLWLKKHQPDKLPEFDDSAQARMEVGNEVENYARRLFDGGEMVESKWTDAVAETEEKVKSGAKVIYHASVLTDRRLFAEADILVRGEDDTWDMYEVKSSLGVKREHLPDLAFQRIAFEESGYKIGKTYMIFINRGFTRQGEIDPNRFLYEKDLTEEVEKVLERTRKGIVEALEVVAAPDCPDDDPGSCVDSGGFYAWREIYKYLHPDLPENSIYDLCRLNLKLVRELAKRGVSDLSQMPANVELAPQQKAQLEALRAGKPVMKMIRIGAELGRLRFPLYFFDYETIFPAIPAFDGTHPYQQVPFQYSLHILNEPGGNLEHREFLWRGAGDPRPALLAQLRDDIGPEGSIVSWNKGFEQMVNLDLGKEFPEYAQMLWGHNKRMYDLMDVFNKGYYIDSKFKGSASIKAVLPVIIPEMNYKDLAISHGGDASNSYYQATMKGSGVSEELAVNLLEYCKQDTLAMVKIYDFLVGLNETAPGSQTTLL